MKLNFVKGLQAFGNLASLERQLMPQLFKNSTKMVLTVVTPNEDWVQAVIEQTEEALYAQLHAVDDYLAVRVAQSRRVLQDPHEIIEAIDALEGDELDLAFIAERVETLRELALAVEMRGMQLDVGCFQVHTSLLNTSLLRKHKNAAIVLLDRVAEMLNDRREELERVFTDIRYSLLKKPENIEDLAALREQLQQLPGKLDRLSIRVNELFTALGVLDRFQYPYPHEDVEKIWHVYAEPALLLQLRDKTEIDLVKIRERFLVEQGSQQDSFAQEVEEVEGMVAEFDRLANLENLNTIMMHVTNVAEKLSLIQNQAQLFNSREELFGVQHTSYAVVDQIVHQFEPFQNLWTTTSTWFASRQAWRYGQLDAILDPDEIESVISNGVRVMARVCKHFKSRARVEPQILETAEQVRKEIEAFRPDVPLLLALKTKGLRERHWTEIGGELKRCCKSDDLPLQHRVAEEGPLSGLVILKVGK